MDDCTYQFEHLNGKLETYEWDNALWEHADTIDIPRVLFIGASISSGIRKATNQTGVILLSEYHASSIRLRRVVLLRSDIRLTPSGIRYAS